MKSIPLHGGQMRKIAERFDIPVSQLLDFSANINPDGPPPSVLTALRACLEDPSTLTNYPDLEQVALKQAIGLYSGLPLHNIVVANGFVPLLECSLRALKIKRCLLPVPSFVEYRRTLEHAEVETVPSVLSAEAMFHYDMHSFSQAWSDAILLANPQNPSGVLTSREALLDLVEQAQGQNRIVLLDEAFIDYIPDHSLVNDVNRYPNLVVFRAVTKFHGCPGLRVAYAVANETLIGLLHTHMAPWPITSLASIAVCAALSDQPFIASTQKLNRDRRIYLEAGLKKLGIQVYESSANFLLFHLPLTIDAHSFWERMIEQHKVVLRACSNYEGLTSGHFRAAVRGTDDSTILLDAMQKLLGDAGGGRSLPA